MRRKQISKHSGKSTLITILLLVVIGGGLLGIFCWEKYQRQQESSAIQDDPYEVGPAIIHYNGVDYRLRDDLDYYLFMGLDKTTETLSDPTFKNNNQQADFLMLMVVDHSTSSYFGVHINRDTMAEIKRLGLSGESLGTYVAQLCLAHAYGSGGKDSCRNQVWSVSRYFFDLPIKHYFAITMDGIPVLNDAVGGVVVHVTDDFSQDDPSLIMGQTIRLQGEQVLSYVRHRKTVADGSNLNRMKRQREYIDSLYRQLNEKLSKDERFFFKLADKIAPYVTSDMTTDELAFLSDSLKGYQFTKIYTIDGEPILNSNNNIEFYTDETSFQALVVKLFYKRIPG